MHRPLFAAIVVLAATGCSDGEVTTSSSSNSSAVTTTSGAGGGGVGGAGAGGGAIGGCGPDGAAPNEDLGAGTDPAGGVFTMADALEDLPEGDGALRAVIDTELGAITCTLHPEEAPNSVANFVGLARGRRPWRDTSSGTWVKRPYYDGLTFHRIIDDFMAQGGDPLGTGTGGPGYQFADEFSSLVHEPGTLSYANSGPNSNGSQFFITEVKTDWLDGAHTVIGYCEPMAVIEALAATPTGPGDRPITPVHTQKVTITRCP